MYTFLRRSFRVADAIVITTPDIVRVLDFVIHPDSKSVSKCYEVSGSFVEYGARVSTRRHDDSNAGRDVC